MKYLYKPRKRRWIIHYWNEKKEDTYCKMWSTGGMKKAGWKVADDNPLNDTVFQTSKKICTMCKSRY